MILPPGAASIAVAAFICMAFAMTFPVFDGKAEARKARLMKLVPAVSAGLYTVLLCSVPYLWLATLIFIGPAYVVYRLKEQADD